MEALRQIYKHAKLELTEDVEEAMLKYIAGNPQHKHGVHQYNLSDYGITIEDITNTFQPFLEYFRGKSLEHTVTYENI